MGILLSAISCQENEFSLFNGELKIKATIEPMETRVTFDAKPTSITPAWAVGDKIIGCDDLGNKFTFLVKSVNNKYAQLDANGYVPGNAKKIFAVYYPGKTVDDIEVIKTDTSFTASLPIDLTAQDGTLGANTPMVMSAYGDITDFGSITLNFVHETSIIGVSKMKVAAGDNIKSVAVTGARTTGTLKISDGKWINSVSGARKPATAAVDLTADGEGIISTPVYVAVIPTTNVNLAIVATTANGEKRSNVNSAIKSDLEAGKYYYTTRILGNVATITETGKLFGSIEEAFKAAEATAGPATIKLLSDCTIIEDMPVLTNSYGITIDLNGKVLSATASVLNSDETMMYKRITIGTANVTIMDSVGGGKINHSAGNTYNIVMTGAGNLTVNSGIIESITPGGSDGSVAILLNDGKLVLNGGTINGNSASYGTVSLRGTETTIPEVTIPATSTVSINSINTDALYLEDADAHIHGGTITTGAGYAINAAENCYFDMDGGLVSAIDPNKDGVDAIAIRFYNGPQAEITGGEFFGTGRAFSSNASSEFSGEKGKISIKGGKFKSEVGYTLYGGRSTDVLIEGGSFYSENNSIAFQGYTSGSLTLAGGYFYTNAASKDSLCIRGNYAKAYGGYFNTTIKDVNITNAKVVKQLDTPVEYDGRKYGYTLGESESYVAEVNGTQYKDMIAAANAAKNYTESGDPVIKLISDCKLDATVDLTNVAFKEIVLDLNGHVLTTTAKDSCITTTHILTITDNSAGAKGMILAEKRKPIFLLESGTINIKKATIECTATGAYTDAQRCIISVKGKSGSQSGQVNISDGAKIIADNWFKCIYVTYGKLTTENCEITSGYKSEKAYFGIYAYSGSEITVNEGTSIKTCGLIDSCGVCFYVGSGNTSVGSLYTINGGYFYGGAQSGAAFKSNKDKNAEESNNYASKTLIVNGGYFRNDISNVYGHYGEGKTLQAQENKHSHMGEELTYNFVVK